MDCTTNKPWLECAYYSSQVFIAVLAPFGLALTGWLIWITQHYYKILTSNESRRMRQENDRSIRELEEANRRAMQDLVDEVLGAFVVNAWNAQFFADTLNHCVNERRISSAILKRALASFLAQGHRLPISFEAFYFAILELEQDNR